MLIYSYFCKTMHKQIILLKSLIEEETKNIVIIPHKDADGDALGSSLALSSLLSQLNHNVKVISPNPYASFLNWMTKNNNVLIYSESNSKTERITNQSDLIFLLDFNSLSRIGDYSNIIKNSNAKRIMIDHHEDPDNNAANIIISNSKSSSTCELLYEVIIQLGYKHLINKDIANYIYTGIMTDTGSFKFPSTTARTHEIISDLILSGAENSKIHDLIYDNYSVKRVNLLGYSISKKLKVFKEYRSAIISLTKEDLSQFNFQKGYTEGIINYALSIKGIRFAVFIAEKEGLVKMSLRSKGNFKVNEIAKKYFNGGGHINASGGISNESIEKTIKKLENIFKEYKNELLTY